MTIFLFWYASTYFITKSENSKMKTEIEIMKDDIKILKEEIATHQRYHIAIESPSQICE